VAYGRIMRFVHRVYDVRAALRRGDSVPHRSHVCRHDRVVVAQEVA
jgi:hypothetical protein